jgi:hypothetical protein
VRVVRGLQICLKSLVCKISCYFAFNIDQKLKTIAFYNSNSNVKASIQPMKLGVLNAFMGGKEMYKPLPDVKPPAVTAQKLPTESAVTKPKISQNLLFSGP